MSTKTKIIPLALTKAKALEILKETSKDSARVFFTEHAEEKMVKRRITRTQVLRCLRHGYIAEGPVRSMKGNWELAIQVLSAGDVMRVAAALDYDDGGNFIVIITAYYVS